VYAINKFRHYVTGYPIFVHIYHVAIKYLMNKLDINGRLIKWILLLQQFDLTIPDKPCKQNVVADFLSSLTNNAEDEVVDDNFPDEHLFSISIETPWFANISNYVAMGKFP
jgi:hypothetical protein